MGRRVFGVFRFIHSWGGITLALLLLSSSITGSLLVWKNDFVLLSFPGIERDFDPDPMALARVAAAAEAQFDNNEILQIMLPTRDFPLAKVSLIDNRYAYLDTQGNIVDQWVLNERWEEWLYDLHHRLLLEDLGLTIVGLMGLAMIILVLAGLVAFWPLRRGFRQGVWPKNMARPRLLLSHRNLGVVEALPLLLTLLTGVLLAFPEKAELYLLEPFRGEDYSMDFVDNLDDVSGGDTGDWLPAMERALSSFPGARIRSVEVPNDYVYDRIIGLQQDGALNPKGLSMVYISAETGKMGLRIDAGSQHISERLYNTAYPLHTGKFDSLVYKLLLTVSGLLVAALSLLGISSFIKKYRR